MESSSSEDIDTNIFSILRAGLQLFLRISRQISSFKVLGWYILVLNLIFGGLKGYSSEKSKVILSCNFKISQFAILKLLN